MVALLRGDPRFRRGRAVGRCRGAALIAGAGCIGCRRAPKDLAEIDVGTSVRPPRGPAMPKSLTIDRCWPCGMARWRRVARPADHEHTGAMELCTNRSRTPKPSA